MVGSLGKVASPFRYTTRKRSGDCTTMMRRRGVGAERTRYVDRKAKAFCAK